MLEATTSVNDEVMRIVSDNLRELIEKTPDPGSPRVQALIRMSDESVRESERSAWRCERRVRETGEMLARLRMARNTAVGL